MDGTFILALKKIIKDEFDLDVDPIIEPTDEQFGDITTNVALQLSSKLGKPPRIIAETIVPKIENMPDVLEVNVAGPGFINLKLKPQYYAKIVNDIITQGENFGKSSNLSNQTIICEYSNPNPFKILHAGHLYTSLVGDSIANLLENSGARVIRANFGGDVGLHVGKAMWGIIKALGGEKPETLLKISPSERLNWVSARYIEGNEAYENDDLSKNQIIEINKKIYKLHENNDQDSAFAQIYWTCRKWSYEGFEALYNKLGMKPFDKYYPESETTPVGLDLVREYQAKGVFEESEGAVVYSGEKDGLHTRVFITSENLPTYETKDIGLALTKWKDYPFDKSIVITGNDIIEYMKVIQAALMHINPEVPKKSVHLTHGIVKLAGGIKMSSRKGNFLRADDILESAKIAYSEAMGNENWDAVLAAVKYSFLKQRRGGDIIYDPNESVSIIGSSGPYLQYAHARAKSIVSKSQASETYEADKSEIPLLKKMQEFNLALDRSLNDMSPHHLATFLFELAQVFNSFYEKERIIGSDREEQRARLVLAYSQILSNGLSLLGISAPEKI